MTNLADPISDMEWHTAARLANNASRDAQAARKKAILIKKMANDHKQHSDACVETRRRWYAQQAIIDGLLDKAEPDRLGR